MPKPLYEGAGPGRLRFDFADAWQAVKFDDSVWYRDAIKSQVKAMDILACNVDSHWWIEVKDCAGFEPANLPRLAPGDPPEVNTCRDLVAAQGHRSNVKVSRAKPFVVDEVAQKLEGTLASLAAARRATAGNPDAALVAPFFEVTSTDAQWSVVLLLTWDLPDFGRLAQRLRDKLQQRLSAYRVQCFVLNEPMTAPAQPWTLTRVVP